MNKEFSNKLYNIFSGNDLDIAETIQRLRLKILIHSCLYYEMNKTLIPDAQFDALAKQLVLLQKEHPAIASQVCFAEAFANFDGSTGFDLPIKDEWVIEKAKKILRLPKGGLPESKPKKSEQKKSIKLF